MSSSRPTSSAPTSRFALALALLTLGSGCTAEGIAATSSCAPPCGEGQLCYRAVCVPDILCRSDDECQEDSFCDGARCVPYPLAPRGDHSDGCLRAVPAGIIAPRLSCQWTQPEADDPYPNHREVLSSPMVIDFDFDGHKSGEFPTTRPSIVVTTYDGSDFQCGLGEKGDGANFGVIRVLDGRTCKQQHVIPVPVNGATPLAVGDIDGDRRPDILAINTAGGLTALRYDPALGAFNTLWQSHDAAGAPVNPVAKLCQWVGPSLTDLDDDGKPEALLEGWVFDRTGLMIDSSLGLLSKPMGHDGGQFLVVADVDRDGSPELITPRALSRWSRPGARWEQLQSYSGTKGTDEFAAVADFGAVVNGTLDRSRRDGVAEVAVISHGKAWILALDGTFVYGPVANPGSIDRGGGPPTIGDFDGDGRAELAAAGSSSFTVFDPDCAPGGDLKTCPSGRTDGVLWTSRSQDQSSNDTGSSLFDFDGDGRAEAVYADECYARIYDGRSGDVLFSQPQSSCTWHEYPTVADVAGDFRARMIVPSNRNCDFLKCPAVDPVFPGLRCRSAGDCPGDLPCQAGLCRCVSDQGCAAPGSGVRFLCRPPQDPLDMAGSTCQAAHDGRFSGLRVYGDVRDRWVSSRPLWNQHAYSITNINDDGTIPRTSETKRSWDVPGLNNFRMNTQGSLTPLAVADLTVRALPVACTRLGEVALRARVCNRGAAPAPDDVPVTFYEGGQRLCSGRTRVALQPGACSDAGCPHQYGTGSAAGLHRVTAVVDDDGRGQSTVSECSEGNNRATLRYTCDDNPG